MDNGGGKLPEKLTRTILQYNNLILKLHVKIKNDNGFFHNEYSYGSNNYLNVNINGFLTLELPKDKENNAYNNTKSFMIGIGNIGNVVTRMKKVLINIYNEKIFAINDNKVVAFEDMVLKFTETITIPRLGQGLMIKPSVVYDENEISYEGVHIYVNNSYNLICLSIDEFENLIYILEKIDIVNASQLLLNYYLISLTSINKIKNVPYTKSVNRFFRPTDSDSDDNKTISNFRRVDNNDDVLSGFQ